ncbi:MAG TPA: dihydrolipoamide acetyltransferase family protein [Phycisphaerae bacterium]|nr:dihydrolipoamide acetyltransferase family protein [Phycisphaerae bacterium]
MKASPAARRLAAQRGIELSTVGAGSGPAGRILSTDLPAAAPASLQAPTVRPAAIRTGPVGQPTRRKLAGMRKAIAKNLTASKQNIPHFYLRGTIDAGALFDTYRRAKAHFKCSVNDFLLAAVARVMGEFPAFRTRLEGEELVEYPTSNVGIAVGLDKGLVVPVLLGADRMALPQLAATTRQIVEAARGGKIEAMGQGNLTITNLGMFGTEEFSAIINPPEAAILAVGAIREAVLVKDGAMRPGRVMTMTLSCDHRVIDGMQAAQFMARLKEVLESPQMLV